MPRRKSFKANPFLFCCDWRSGPGTLTAWTEKSDYIVTELQKSIQIRNEWTGIVSFSPILVQSPGLQLHIEKIACFFVLFFVKVKTGIAPFQCDEKQTIRVRGREQMHRWIVHSERVKCIIIIVATEMQEKNHTNITKSYTDTYICGFARTLFRSFAF